MIGRVISGRYVVQAIVGTGGMAIVYRAFDKKKNRIVAIKVFPMKTSSICWMWASTAICATSSWSSWTGRPSRR